MNINDILTEDEYTKERSAKELFEWFTLKDKELLAWSKEHSGTAALRKMKHTELSSGLPYKFTHELIPFAYFAKTYYSNTSHIKFKPCCGSEQYDGIIFDNNKKVFVEFTNAINGEKWGYQKELLVENGYSPWEHNIHGVKGNKTKRKRSASDIITSDELIKHTDVTSITRELLKTSANNKCQKSKQLELPYGQNETILIITFDDTGFSEKDWSDLIDFKEIEIEIDSIEHNFRKIILFGWLDKKFIT